MKASLFAVPLLIFISRNSLPAQSAPAFEVASVKPADTGGDEIELTPGALLVHGGRLATCIKWAFDVQQGQVAGGTPAISNLLGSERFEIDAKTQGPVPEARARLMLQSLLAERFHLAFHKDSRQMQAFGLTVDRSGPKFRESQGVESRVELRSKLNRSWTRTTIAGFANTLADAMQAPVLDQTGLAGNYDIALDLTPYMSRTGERPDIAAMMVTALREELGLRLVSLRAPFEVIVIDRLERPSSN
ncbi:MAG TPA: TIGR03435 family protein [Bryobacteraceae bacterium]|jgi:uncharacterized protein (TIGR03435 family)|nr:TIGR03435 family protein [Bryobacteraceae bacterium]